MTDNRQKWKRNKTCKDIVVNITDNSELCYETKSDNDQKFLETKKMKGVLCKNQQWVKKSWKVFEPLYENNPYFQSMFLKICLVLTNNSIKNVLTTSKQLRVQLSIVW